MTNRWWAPAERPDSQPISARRAYAEVLAVFAAFFGAGVIAAAVSLAGNRSGTDGSLGWGAYGPAAFSSLGQAGLALTVVVLLGRIRGRGASALGLAFRRGANGRIATGAEVRVAAWAVLALVVGSIVTSIFKTAGYPFGRTSASNLVYGAVRSFNAGIVEETVVLAFLVITLEQARRRSSEIVAVALVLRASYHIYYGPGVIGILVWASLFVWLFLRTRSLLPLIITHVAWDLFAFLGRGWPAVYGLEVLAIFGLLIAAPISWLGERSRAVEQRAALEGIWGSWHRDPSGEHMWRWWTGTHWTEAVADTPTPLTHHPEAPITAARRAGTGDPWG